MMHATLPTRQVSDIREQYQGTLPNKLQ